MSDIVVTLGPRDLVEVRGRSAAGPFVYDLVAFADDDRSDEEVAL